VVRARVVCGRCTDQLSPNIHHQGTHLICTSCHLPPHPKAPEHRRHFDVHAFMKQHAGEGAPHGMMPIAAATLWLGMYKH
jgi:hypothetical protein